MIYHQEYVAGAKASSIVTRIRGKTIEDREAVQAIPRRSLDTDDERALNIGERRMAERNVAG